MGFLKRLIEQILKEDTLNDMVKDAISKRYEVYINYDGEDHEYDKGKGKGRRLIQPVAFGLTKKGNPVVRAFQPQGDTKTKRPAWKFFLLDRIKDWQPNKRTHFKEPPGVYNAEGKFNPQGDGMMSTVYMVADFEGAQNRYEKSGLYKYNQGRTQQANERDPFRGLKANIRKMKPFQQNYKDILDRNLKIDSGNKNIWKDYDKAEAERNATYRDKNNRQEMQYASKSMNNVGDTETVGVQQKQNTEQKPLTKPAENLNYNKNLSGIVPKNNNGKPLNGDEEETEEE